MPIATVKYASLNRSHHNSWLKRSFLQLGTICHNRNSNIPSTRSKLWELVLQEVGSFSDRTNGHTELCEYVRNVAFQSCICADHHRNVPTYFLWEYFCQYLFNIHVVSICTSSRICCGVDKGRQWTSRYTALTRSCGVSSPNTSRKTTS